MRKLKRFRKCALGLGGLLAWLPHDAQGPQQAESQKSDEGPLLLRASLIPSCSQLRIAPATQWATGAAQPLPRRASVTWVTCAEMFGEICSGSATTPHSPSRTWANAPLCCSLVPIRRVWDGHLPQASNLKMLVSSLQVHWDQRAPLDG